MECSLLFCNKHTFLLGHYRTYSKKIHWKHSLQQKCISQQRNFFPLPAQSAIVDLCEGNRHQIVGGAWVKAMKVVSKLLVALVEVAKVAQLIGLSSKCGTIFTLCCGLARLRVESDKIVPKIRLSSTFGACAGRNSENGKGISHTNIQTQKFKTLILS